MKIYRTMNDLLNKLKELEPKLNPIEMNTVSLAISHYARPAYSDPTTQYKDRESLRKIIAKYE